MGVVSTVGSTILEHGAQRHRVDVVAFQVVVFIPGDDEEGTSREEGQAGSQELVQILASIGQTGIVAVIVNVGSVVHVLRQVTRRQISIELSRVDNVGATSGVVANVIERNERVVLAVVRSYAVSSRAVTGVLLLISLPRGR